MKKCVFFGYSQIGYEALKSLINLRQEISVVYTHQDNPDENIWFDSVYELATEHNILVRTEKPTVDELNNIDCDVVVMAYYRDMLPTNWLIERPLGSYNLHGSLLPKFRGAQPTNWAVIAGEKQTGLTMHKVGEQLDGGDIVGQIAIDIKPNHNAFDVMKNITPLANKLINKYWDNIISGQVYLTPQNLDDNPIYPRRKPDDGLIDFRTSARNVHNLIRGVTKPYPGAFFMLNNKKVIVWESEVDEFCDTGITASVLGHTKNPTIKCHSGAIEIICATYEDGTDATTDLKTGIEIN